MRQCSKWAKDAKTTPITRTLRYPWNWPNEREEEKGIDVALAVDLAMMAVKGEYDTGVPVSTDTDLKPALEAVAAMPSTPFPRLELAAWSSPQRHSHRLSIAGCNLWCHWLTVSDYWSVSDPTNYAQPGP